jgi:hypothetical protein
VALAIRNCPEVTVFVLGSRKLDGRSGRVHKPLCGSVMPTLRSPFCFGGLSGRS